MPAGTFDTIRFTLSFRLYGDIQGTPVDETSTSVLWLAPDIGIIQDNEVEFGLLKLVDTNVASKIMKRSGAISTIINTLILSD